MNEVKNDIGLGKRRLIRIGGLAVLIALGLHMYLNGALKEFPPIDATQAELQEYFAAETTTWAIVHGLKYLALVGLVLFAAAVFTRTCLTRDESGVGWGVVGLLGSAIHVTNALIANGIEAFAFYDFTKLSEDASLFWLLFYLVRVLFTAEIVAWGVTIFGFSMAGRQTSTLPRWTTWLGIVCAIACLGAGVFVISVLTNGWASIVMTVAELSGLLWFTAVGVVLLVRGDK